MRGASRRPGEAGFSLVEVIVALGLLAAVLVAMSGLFTLANHQLASGRNHSVAISVARDILEETGGWGFHQTYSTFGFDGAASFYTVDSRSHPAAAAWQATLESELAQPRAEIEIRSVGGGALRTATVIRVQVTVHWSEGLRARSLRLTTVRV